MAKLTQPLGTSRPNSALNDNRGVDYVLNFKYGAANPSKASNQFERLIQALDSVGLRTEARDGAVGSILVFITVKTEARLIGEVYRSRVKDWLYGIRQAAPDKETQKSLDDEPLSDAERLRIVYDMITGPKSEGGADVAPGRGQWDLVVGLFPLHDHKFNKDWMKTWSTKMMLSPKDLTQLRDKFGEKVAFYFAFLQSYFMALIPASALGASTYFLLPSYSPIFAIANCLWSVVFIEWWTRSEVDLAVRWGVNGVGQIQRARHEFISEKDIVDPVTGETVKFFPEWKRLGRQIAQIPFALAASFVIAGFIACCFGIEIFVSEVYNGPFKSVLVFTPTVLLCTILPTITALFTSFATKLNNWENYQHAGTHESALVRKEFVFNFMTAYVPLMLTAFVYVPFGSWIVPKLDVFGMTVTPFAEDEKDTYAPSSFDINPGRLRKQVFYFTVTAQWVNFALEAVVPVVKKKVFARTTKIQSRMKGYRSTETGADPFVARAKREAELDIYDPNADLREMCMQFGYLTLFSSVWPLTALSFLINNWLEARSDAAKICLQMQRPIPQRVDSIGPWLDNLGLLTWLGSVTSAALVYMFSGEGFGKSGPNGTPDALTLGGLLTAVVFSEHIYFIARLAVRGIIARVVPSPGLELQRREKFQVRKRYLEESLGVEARQLGSVGQEKEGGMGGAGVSDGEFWKGQGWQGTVRTGWGLIEMKREEGKKKQ